MKDIKRHYPKKKKDLSDKESVEGGVNVCELGYDSVDTLVVSERAESNEWVMDDDCSFHMTPKKH